MAMRHISKMSWLHLVLAAALLHEFVAVFMLC